MVCALSDASGVRARLAELVATASGAVSRVGEFLLRPSQCEAVVDIERALARHGGALLADPPGSGKTIIGLAVAQQYEPPTLVLAPATLRRQWLETARRAETEIHFVSIELLSRGTTLPDTRLVIVDEAHHFRTSSTARYARLASHVASRRLLLLSGTPVVNRGTDRDALLALIFGSRAEALDDVTLAEVLIRRRRASERRPQVERLPMLEVPESPVEIDDAIRGLPPPLPAADGRAATVLVRITLALAWRSSLAALDRALARRLERGAALADCVASGRWPTRAALRLWVLGDDSTQLALPLRLDGDDSAPPTAAIGTIEAHCAAVRSLRARIAPFVARDTAARAAALVALLDAHPSRRVVCFCQHAATIRALWSLLRLRQGVVAITGTAVRAASGRWTRDEVLRALGRDAPMPRANDPRAVRLLLATDLLAEGVEMPGVGIVVHGDAAWTPARLEQRVGRAARDQGSGTTVLVTQFRAPRGAAALLELGRRLARKREARSQATAVARGTETLRTILNSWRLARRVRGDQIATVSGPRRSFLAALVESHHRGVLLVGGTRRDGRWRLTLDPTRLATIASDAVGAALPNDDVSIESIRAILDRFARRRLARSLAPPPSRERSALWKRVRKRTERAVAAAPLGERTQLAESWSEALRVVAATAGIGAQRTVAAMDRQISDDREFIDSLQRRADQWRVANAARFGGADSALFRLDALLLVCPDS